MSKKQAERLQRGFPSIVGPAFDYQPIAVDSLEARLAQFDAEREEREAVAWRDRQIEEWRTESQKPGNWMMRIPYLTSDCFDIHETDLEES